MVARGGGSTGAVVRRRSGAAGRAQSIARRITCCLYGPVVLARAFSHTYTLNVAFFVRIKKKKYVKRTKLYKVWEGAPAVQNNLLLKNMATR